VRVCTARYFFKFRTEDVTLKYFADMEEIGLKGSYWLTRIAFLRLLAFIYLVAFLVALNQNKELIGDNGLLPLQLYMERLEKIEDWLGRVSAAPTLFWLMPSWSNVNWALDSIATAGIAISLSILVSGASNMFALATLWILYHSIVAVGQTWYSFGWYVVACNNCFSMT
jgi:hypothetical protein